MLKKNQGGHSEYKDLESLFGVVNYCKVLPLKFSFLSFRFSILPTKQKMNRNQFLMKRLPNESKRYLSKGTNENKVLNSANFHKFFHGSREWARQITYQILSKADLHFGF